MSRIEAHIDLDYNNLKKYFEEMFKVLENAKKDEEGKMPEVYDADTVSFPDTYTRISHLIKPDMVINIYSYLEFWLQKISSMIKEQDALKLSLHDVKGSNDFHKYRIYIEKYAGLEYDESLEKLYDGLDNLRLIRNKFIHNGGYIKDNEQNKINNMEYISVSYPNLIVIEKEYIYFTLECAKNYLLCIVKKYF